ncbi:MAG: hypothetical protein IPJ23_14750 [Ignavibacteriales bacterium]|nr:hypothetical protein [Ignavibacteriales bacterium]
MSPLKYFIRIIVFVIVLFTGCSKDETETGPKEYLDYEYTGTLRLHFTNDFPSIDKTVSVNVQINKYGDMTFGTGSVSYDADENNGQTRIRRNGTLTLNPNGSYFFDNMSDKFDVKENTTINETMTVWYGDGVNWTQAFSENINSVWNGGLVFSLDEAVMTGSHVSVSTGSGSADWELNLDVVP